MPSSLAHLTHPRRRFFLVPLSVVLQIIQYTPPRVKLMTTGNNTVRFNPNFYRMAKCGLFIFQNLDGTCMSPAQSLSSVLISIQSLMTENPYHNEPGFEQRRHSGDSKNYNECIRHETFVWLSVTCWRASVSVLMLYEEVMENPFWNIMTFMKWFAKIDFTYKDKTCRSILGRSEAILTIKHSLRIAAIIQSESWGKHRRRQQI
ncbi:hypothetical protein GDO86_014340 [Hymenochirus boettgeri]|uniref:Ubiquitin-conjugating enzyme E2 Z n=1 Tax=Hymenochirus boettgeri TaxID=247094 RepID=A0A8T2JTT4_9PIPI|nr:hypothetical protein GDO86_014340 [Hymenochirus boettgeri]